MERWADVGVVLVHRLHCATVVSPSCICWNYLNIMPVERFVSLPLTFASECRTRYRAGSVLVHCHRRLTNIEPGGCNNSCLLCLYVANDRPGRHETFARCLYSVGPQSAALYRRCSGVGWTSFVLL